MSKKITSAPHELQPKLSHLHYIIPPALLTFFTTLIYYPSLHYAFQFDDIANITQHFNIRHYTLSRLFFSGTRWISYWINSLHYKIGGFNPFSYRIFSVALHTCNGILIFFILLYGLLHLKKKSFFTENALIIAFINALLFLLHPVQTQTVSYVIQGQLEGLAAFFILSMSLLLMLLAQATNKFTKNSLILSLACLAFLSSGSKEIAIISPAFLLLIDWFFIAQGRLSELKKRLWIHAGITTIIFSCYIWLLKPKFFTDILGLKHVVKNNIGNVITHSAQDAITPWTFFISQFKVILHYLSIFVWPFSLSVEYDWMLCKRFFTLDCVLPFLTLLSIAYYTFSRLKKNNSDLIAFGFLWFFTAIAPRSSIIPSPELLVDYKTYTASFGIYFLLGTVLTYALKKITETIKAIPATPHARNGTVAALSLLLALPLGLTTIERNTVWRSGLEFWGNILKNAPNKARAHNNYGVELSQNLQKFKESVPYFKKAIELDKQYPDPCNNLAVAYSHIGELDLAITALKKGLAINPHHPEGYNNLASFYLRKKDYNNAEKCLRTALKIRPHYGKAYFNLGRIFLEQGEDEKAWQSFKNCCTKADLDNEFGFSAFAQASFALQKYEDAIFAYTKILSFNPSNENARFNLANSFFFTQQYNHAEKEYQRLLEIYPNNMRGWYNLGETYFITQQPAKALECYHNVTPDGEQFNQLQLRIAGCYEKTGQPRMCQQVLHALLQKPIDYQDKQVAQSLLAQLEKKYNFASSLKNSPW